MTAGFCGLLRRAVLSYCGLLLPMLFFLAAAAADEVQVPKTRDFNHRNFPGAKNSPDPQEAVLQARFASLANSLGKIPKPPKVNKTIHLPMMEMEIVRDGEEE